MTTMLCATDLCVRLGDRPILYGLSYRARAGRFSAIVGPNGSGKTTLLRALTGELAHQGRIMINGRALASFRPWELAALRGVLPQSTALAFPFSVIEVVRLGLTTGLSAARADLPIAALGRVGLADFANRPYHDLSGGEMQRVQLARVLTQVWQPVQDGVPRWLFLDEPVSSLDIGHQLLVMSIARDFAAGGGGVVAVMHDLNLTAMFADDVVLLQRGRIIARGAPDAVLTDAALSTAYGCDLRTNTPPPGGGRYILPQGAVLPQTQIRNPL